MLDIFPLDIIHLILYFSKLDIRKVAKLRQVCKGYKNRIDEFGENTLFKITNEINLSNWDDIQSYFFQKIVLNEELYRKTETVLEMKANIKGILFYELNYVGIWIDDSILIGIIKRDLNTDIKKWSMLKMHHGKILIMTQGYWNLSKNIFIRLSYKSGDMIGYINTDFIKSTTFQYMSYKNWSFFFGDKLYWLKDEQIINEIGTIIYSQSHSINNLDIKKILFIENNGSIKMGCIKNSRENEKTVYIFSFSNDGELISYNETFETPSNMISFGNFYSIKVIKSIIFYHSLVLLNLETLKETKILQYSNSYIPKWFCNDNIIFISLYDRHFDNIKKPTYFKLRLQDFENGKMAIQIQEKEFFKVKEFCEKSSPKPFGILSLEGNAEKHFKLKTSCFNLELYKNRKIEKKLPSSFANITNLFKL